MPRLRTMTFMLVVVGLVVGLAVTPVLASSLEGLAIVVSDFTRKTWESEIAPRFEKQYGVRVEIRSYPMDMLPQRIMTDASAGTLTYDLASMPYGYIPAFVEGGLLEDLSQSAEEFGRTNLAPVTYSNRVYGVSLPGMDWVESLVVFATSTRKNLALELLKFAALSEKPQHEQIKVGLESITMVVALSMQNANNREWIYGLTQKSEDPEGIVKLREFVSVMDDEPIREIFSKEELGHRIQVLEERMHRDLDVYFPVDRHRENWSSDEMLVSCGPFWLQEHKIEEIAGIIAYEWDGTVRWLNPWVPPQTPTLVVARSERSSFQTETETSSKETVYFARLRIPTVDMLRRIEFWFRGSAELYLCWKVAQNGWMESPSHVSPNEYPNKRHFPRYKRVWADGGLWQDPNILLDRGRRQRDALYLFSWWEYDGSPTVHIITVEFSRGGVLLSYQIEIHDGDDEAGRLVVQYESIPTERPVRPPFPEPYSTGIVDWELYRTD